GDRTIKEYDPATGAYLGGISTPAVNTDTMAFGPDGSLYTTDYYANRILHFDPASGSLLGTFASGGALNGPIDVQFGPDDDVYVLNSKSGTLSRFAPTG